MHYIIFSTVILFALANNVLARDTQEAIQVTNTPPSIVWAKQFDTHCCDAIPMIIDNNYIFFGTRKLNRLTGSLIHNYYQTILGNRIKSIDIRDQNIVVASMQNVREEERDRSFDYFWTVFNLKTGKERWSDYQNSRDHSVPFVTINGNNVYIIKGALFNELIAKDILNGKVIWKKEIPYMKDLVSCDNSVFVQTGERVFCFDALNGKRQWETPLPGGVWMRMSAGKSYLTISRFDPDQEKSILVTLDAHDGQIIWKHEFPHGFLFRTAQFDGKVLAAVESDKDFESGQLLAFSLGDGKIVWSNRIAIDSNGHDFTPVRFGGQVLIWSGDINHVKEFGSSGKIRLMAYNAMNGKHEWEYFPETEECSIFSQPVTADRYIYFNDQQRIFCIRKN